VAAINQLKTPQTQKLVDNEPFPFMLRADADTIPAVNQLIALGPAAVDDMLNEFRKTPSVNDDSYLELLAYVLEKIGDKRAVPVLADWLDQNMFVAFPGWATDFVTHTIKVLQPQPGLNTTTYIYLIDEKVDTVLQAKQGGVVTQAILSSPVVAQGVVSGTFTPEQKQSCTKKVTVTGINKDGQEETLDLNYNVFSRDINGLINDQSVSQAERDRAVVRRRGWEETDEEHYGGINPTYVPGTNSQITDNSNCAGSVIEQIFNKLFAMKGIPMTMGPGGSDATKIRDIAKAFGTEVSIKDIDLFTVIALENDGVGHVEVPVAISGSNATVLSKFDQGKVRFHAIDLNSSLPDANQFRPAIGHITGNHYFVVNGGVNVKFYKIDPARIKSIVVDSSRCPCTPGDPAGIPVQFSQPSQDEVSDRVVTVSGTVGTGAGDTPITSGATILVNGNAQNIAVVDGSFQAQVVLRSGDNDLRVGVEGVDGRRGCAVKKIKSTTARTTLSATLTWNLDDADVDLYVTEPTGQTAWYRALHPSGGGRLDVDNTRGFGPENYFVTFPVGDMTLSGTYTIRVHYYSDHREDDTHPTRPVTWKVVVLSNEGTPKEKYEVFTGTLSAANSGNDAPGSGGADWATAKVVNFSVTP
jgi:uncharacterized protein YfaP (DUF2135 family)